jgi:two-component system response regulator AgrA
MIKIVICEDDDNQRKKIEIIIKDILIYNSLQAEISLTTPYPDKVIKFVDKNKSYGCIYILDIDLKSSMDGIVLASKIREIDVNCFIVFITAYSHMSYLTFEYKLEAMDYIIKDAHVNIKERIYQCLLKAISNLNILQQEDFIDKDFFLINTRTKYLKTKYRDIMFFETIKTNHKIRIHMNNGQLEFNGYINEITAQVGEGFYRCHRGYLVNVNNIEEIDKENDMLRMCNGEQCFYSRRMIKGLLSVWNR